MSTLTTILYAASAAVVIQGVLALASGLRAARYMHQEPAGLRERYSVPAVVFCPSKGIPLRFEDNVRSLLGQDHPDFQIIFIVESADDPAYRALERLGARDIWIAGPASRSGQKVHNLAHAVERYAGRAQVFAFADADARFPASWLSELVAPLRDDRVGSSTGYRWYVPMDRRLPTLLRSAWNASIVGMLGDHGRNFAWGGSMAIRRDTFERIGVRQFWLGSVSDDFQLTRAVRRAGLRIVFVPSCLVPTYDTCSWSELLEFTTRQITITRVYSPGLWWMGFIAQSAFSSVLLSLTLRIFFDTMALGLWTAIYAIAATHAYVRLIAVRQHVVHPALSRLPWFYVVSPPPVSLLYVYNLIHSIWSRRIEWSGIRYRLISPNRTHVCR